MVRTSEFPGSDDHLAPAGLAMPRRQVWPVVLRATIVVAFTVGCTVAVLTAWASPVRVIFAFGFLLFGPGLALAEVLEIRDLAQRLTISVATSLALETLLWLSLIYAGAFSLRLAILILAAVTLIALGAVLVRELSHRRRSQPRKLTR